MTPNEVDALKARLQQAKDKLKIRSPRDRSTSTYETDYPKLWHLKLQMILEQNQALEQRLAWEIKQRNLIEQYTRYQIRQLQEILEYLLKKDVTMVNSKGPEVAVNGDRNILFNASQSIQNHNNSLTPLLTEVMHVQLKFAETMQSLNQSVQARDNLLSNKREEIPTRIEDSASEDDEPTMSMAAYTRMLDHEERSPSFDDIYSPPLPSRRHQRYDSTQNEHEDHIATPAFMSPWVEHDVTMASTTPTTDESKRTAQLDVDMSTPIVGRAITFQDCNDDDDDEEMFVKTRSETGQDEEQSTIREDLGAQNSITSSSLNRSSFLAEFNQFRKGVISNPSPEELKKQYELTDVFSNKAQWSLEAQRLCAERAMLMLEQSGTPTQLKELDNAIHYARSQVIKFS